MSTALDQNTTPREHATRPTAVAVEVLLLQPHGLPEPAAPAEPGLWPMFVMVVTEPAGRAALPLFELLAQPKHPNELSIAAAATTWSLLDPADALLTVTIRAAAPVTFDLRILLPAAPVLDLLDVVARGATIGITTRERAAGLRGRVNIATALRDVVLLSCPPSAELADLTAVLRTTHED